MSNDRATGDGEELMPTPGPDMVLIGLRGSGKSTLGLALSRRLGRDFVDLDDVTAKLMGASGPGEAIGRDGIDAFRQSETRALTGALSERGEKDGGRPGRVIALGGGTPTAPGCADALREAQQRGLCAVIYLRGAPATLRERLDSAQNTDRPPLLGSDAVDEVQEIFDQRDGLYQELAQSVVHIDGVSEESLAQALEALARAGLA